ncbi:rhomboid family intramembrane serine protease [Caldisericum exile]|uniref:rhomboid family intramembrane serine protease n=1 Tax=Caldisericum exile TaxID=693075 RepID=UPI003C71EE97
MLPLRDTEEIETFPFITISLIVINSFIFAYVYFTAISTPNPDQYLASIYLKYGLVPTRLLSSPPFGLGYLTFITSIFLHGSWSHLIFNMLFLWIFGNNVEDYLGHFHFLIFYLLSGIFASLIQILTMGKSSVPVIGASGAIAGTMGAYFLLFPRSRIRTLVFIFFFITIIEIPAPVYLLIWFLSQLFEGLSNFGVASGIAFFAHISGFIFGLFYALLIGKHAGRKRRYLYYI